MARILCMTTGLRGVLHAGLEVVRRLECAGHRVSFASPSDVGDVVRAHGIEYHQLPALDFDPSPQLERGSGGRLAHKWREMSTARARQQQGVERLEMDAFRTLLRELDPDLVLLDVELHEYVMTAFTLGRRVGLLNHFFSIWRQKGLPPLQSDIVPGEGMRGSRFGLAWAWTKQRWKLRRRYLRTRLRYFGTDRRGVLLRYARELGFPRDLVEPIGWESILTFRGIPTLNLTAVELEFPHRPAPWMHYVGPMVHHERRDARPEESARVRALVEETRSAGRPLVFCTASTMSSHDVGFARRVVDASDGKPWTLLLVADETALSRALSRGIPPNVSAMPWVPQLDALAAADVAMHHGGIHGLHECLEFGVPMLVHSGGRFDQNGNAARVAYHGLGRIGDRARDAAITIAAEIESLLEDRPLRERLTSMRSQCVRYREDRRLETAVEGLLG